MSNPIQVTTASMVKPGKQEPEGFIGKKELARRIQRSTRTIGVWMTKGTIPYYKIGTAVLFKWSEVEDHVRKSKVCRRVRFD